MVPEFLNLNYTDVETVRLCKDAPGHDGVDILDACGLILTDVTV